MERYSDSAETFKKALAANPSHILSLNGMGMALAKLGHDSGAVDAFDRSLELDPSQPKIWFSKSSSLRKLGRTNEASDAARRASLFEGSAAMAASSASSASVYR